MSRHDCLATYEGKIVNQEQCFAAAPSTQSGPEAFSVSTRSLSAVTDEPEPFPDKYLYHDGTGLALGHGYSPNDPTKFKIACILKEDEKLNPGPPHTQFKYTYVRSADRLAQAASVDVGIEARFLGGDAKFSSKYSNHSLDLSNEITVVMTAETDFGRWDFKPGAHLTPDALLLRDQEPQKFRHDCGERYVIAESRGASASAVITISSVSRDFKSSFETSISLSGSTGAFSGDARVMFSKELEKAATQDRVTVEAYAIGGKGIEGLQHLVKAAASKPNAEELIASALGEYLSTFTEANAATTVYYTSSMEDFHWKPVKSDAWSEEKERKLRLLALEYNQVYWDRELAKQFVAGSHPLSKVFPEWKPSFAGLIPRADSYLGSLKVSHARCIASSPGIPSDCDIPKVGGMTFQPLADLVREFMMPLRLALYSTDLTEDQLKIVLNQPNANRIATAKTFKPAISDLGAMLQPSLDSRIVLAWHLEFVGKDGDVWQPFSDLSGNAGTPWWESISSDNLEDSLKAGMAKWGGSHEGIVFEVLISKTKAVYRIPFMKVQWRAANNQLHDYRYELIY